MSKEKVELNQLRANAELRKAASKMEFLEESYKKYGFMDFLKSINEYYLDGKGEIREPYPYISTDIQQDESIDVMTGLKLENIRPKFAASLLWEDRQSEKIIELILGLSRGDEKRFHKYVMVFWTESKSKEFNEDNIKLAVDLQRNFSVHYEDRKQVEVSDSIDDALITFSGELLESGIIREKK